MSKKILFVSGIAIAMLISGCASGPKQSVVPLEWKGQAIGIQIPEWVIEANTGSAVTLETNIKEYKDMYCFVVNERGKDLAFLQEWAKRVAGNTEIAGFITTTVANEVQSAMKNKEGKGGVDDDADSRTISAVGSVFSNASYTGARRVADFWYLGQNKNTGDKAYEMFALFVVDKKILNDQVARNLQNVADNNKAMSAAERAIYTDLIASIRSHGLRGNS